MTPLEPYVTVDYRKQILEFLKFIYKDTMIKDKDGKEIPLPIYAVYPKTFDLLPCVTYNEINNKSLADNLQDQFFPKRLDDPNDKVFDYTSEEWNKSQEDTSNRPLLNLNKAPFEYTPKEWNEMVDHFKRTGEKLWKDPWDKPKDDEEDDTEEDLMKLDLDDEVEDNEDEDPNEEVPSIPSTPVEYPFKDYNPIIYAELEYQVEFWSKSLTKIIEYITLLDEYIIHSPARINKTYTSADLYEVDTQIYHKVVRYKFVVDNKGNIFKGMR